MTDVSETVPTPDFRDDSGPPMFHMALRRDELAADGMRRIALAQVDVASWHVQRLGEANIHVHEVRKATKRARAVLRMVQDGIGERAYCQTNTTLRDAAADLSELRSATVRIETIDMLVERQQALAEFTGGLRRELVADATAMRTAVAGDPLRVDDLFARIESVRADIARWAPSPDASPTSMGLRRTYRGGRRGMARAYCEKNAESFHRWRKQAKYLRYQMEVLSPCNPSAISPIVASLEEIGARLGTDHDLDDLLSAVRDGRDVFASFFGRDQLIDAIARRRAEIETELRPIAERIYGQPPREFAGRMTRYWAQWRGEESMRPGSADGR